MSKKLNIDNPDEYWTKEWLELDADQDGYLSKDEVKEAYPKHGADAFQYMDQNGDGWVSMAEWYEIYK
jgi:Ca2+-binding EF-hand superfamily protein